MKEKDNKFITKFKSKTNTKLKEIISNHKSYQKKAVDASIYILKNRTNKTKENIKGSIPKVVGELI